VLAADFILNAGIWEYILGHIGIPLIIGAIGFIVVCIFMRISNHRGFSHSFLALILLSISLGLMCAPLVLYFAIGFLSHLLLDLLNKQPIRLFFPSEKGFCLKIFYADKTANTVFLIVGLIAIILLLLQQIILA
jgi:inner membrane protein